MRKARFREALSHAHIKEDRTGIMYWALDFQSIKLPTAHHCLSLNIFLSMFLQNKSSGRSPTLWFIQGLDLVKDVEFWVQRPRQPAASDATTHPGPWAAASACLTTSFLGQLPTLRGASLPAPKTDFAISSPRLQSQADFLWLAGTFPH